MFSATVAVLMKQEASIQTNYAGVGTTLAYVTKSYKMNQ
jgi:hypothetical protein